MHAADSMPSQRLTAACLWLLLVIAAAAAVARAAGATGAALHTEIHYSLDTICRWDQPDLLPRSQLPHCTAPGKQSVLMTAFPKVYIDTDARIWMPHSVLAMPANLMLRQLAGTSRCIYWT